MGVERVNGTEAKDWLLRFYADGNPNVSPGKRPSPVVDFPKKSNIIGGNRIAKRSEVMKKTWIWVAAILSAATWSERAYAEAPALPVAVETVESQATDERFFTFNESSGTITRYSDEGPKDVVIPETIEGVQVRAIGYGTFKEKGLISVVLPEGLEEIGMSAFDRNRLRSLKLPSSLKSIGTYAFSDNQLTTVNLPEGLETIQDGAFFINRLTTVTTPKSLLRLGKMVFAQNQLTSVNFSEGLISIDTSCFSTNQLQTLRLPSTLEKIGEYAFGSNLLKTLTLPENLVEIGASAFQKNRLTSVFFPEEIREIGKYSFAENELSEVKIPSSLTVIPEGAFLANAIRKLTLHADVKEIEESAFAANPLPEASVPKGCSFHEEAFDPKTTVFVEYPKVQKSEAKLTVRFNRALKAVGAEDVALKLDGTKVEIRCEVQGERLIITPVGALEAGKTYRLDLYPTLQPVKGNGLKYPVTVFFKYLG